MNTTNNLDSFNSTSPLFRDLTDDQAAQVSGGFVSEIHLSNGQAQGLLGGDYDNEELYSLVVFDTNGDNTYAQGDDYFIESSSDIHFVNGTLYLNSEEAIPLGLSDGSNPHLSTSLGLGADGVIHAIGQASPARASMSRSR